MSVTCKQLMIQSSTQTLVDIAFSFERSFALIGQSGSGKSLTLKALLGMLPSTLHARLDMDNTYPLIRGKTVAMVPQNPFTALSPLTKISKHFTCKPFEANEYMERVELDAQLLERFPSELSGGQLQRIIIALALSIKPKLLLLDEPTTALDEGTKEHILRLLKKTQDEDHFDIFFVTHDVSTIEGLCDEVGILRNGVMVEKGSTEAILHSPCEDYTKALLEAGFYKRSKRA